MTTRRECLICEATDCSRHCGKCGNLINPEIHQNTCTHSRHLGYLTQGKHEYCPDCGISLQEETITLKK